MNLSRNHGARQRGFTLIELMIVVVIVGILIGVALPAFQKQVLKGHRSAAQSEMLEIANRQHQYLLANRVFTNDPNDFGYTMPTEVDARYDLSVSVDNTGVPSFTITFDSTGPQAAEDDMTLNSEGVKTPSNYWD